jgi:transmembrane sensor
MTSISEGDSEDGDIVAQAVGWQVASCREDMDWDGFTTWLEADPRHRLTFDEVALTDRLVCKHRLAFRAVADPEDAPVNVAATRKIRWLPAGLAAAVAAGVAILVGPLLLPPAERGFATGATSRMITLADGSSVVLAPRSRLVISGRSNDAMQLNGGAWFDIRHVAGRELAITAGPVTIRDVGTRFDVQEDAYSVRVAVAQGKVDVASQSLSQPIVLAEGRTLLFDNQMAIATTASANIADIGGWRQDRLTYQDAPLPLVAKDLDRYAGTHLDVAADLRNRRFSGTLIVGNRIEAPRNLARLMGLALVCGRNGLRLAPGSYRAPPC